MRRLPLSFFVLSALATATTASAQWNIYHSASTAAGSYRRGAADIIRSEGIRNLTDSQAAINFSDARSRQLDNQIQSVNTFWEKRNIYNQHLQQKNYEIQQDRARKMSRHGLKSLTTQQFDRTTGQINWPDQLKVPEFDQYRNELDEVFKKRAQGGMLSGQDYLAATTDFKDWHQLLVSQKNMYPRPILDQMLRFLLALKRELDDNLS